MKPVKRKVVRMGIAGDTVTLHLECNHSVTYVFAEGTGEAEFKKLQRNTWRAVCVECSKEVRP